jgi:hypothetical protein
VFDRGDSELTIRILPDYVSSEVNSEPPLYVVPATHLGSVVRLTSELMRATWDYGLSHSTDDRFRAVRRLEATGVVARRDVELAVVSIREGSLEIVLEWLIAIVGPVLLQEVALGVGTNALWDLTKWNFRALRGLLRREEEVARDPMINELLAPYIELAQEAFTSVPERGHIETEFTYRGPDVELSFTIDRRAQEQILELGRVETESIMRLIGSIVGIDYSQEVVGIRFEHFPYETVWCDVGGLDLDRVSRYLPTGSATKPKRVGVDVEVAWRRGAARVFPPDSVRILRLVPEDQILNPSYDRPFERPPIYGMAEDLQREEVEFLKWFSWADDNWTDPNIAGTVNYLASHPHVLGRQLSQSEIENLVKRLIQRGMLHRVRGSRRRSPRYQALRLNRNHPIVIRYLGRT